MDHNYTVGDVFKIQIDSNATTGYKWELAVPLDSELLELQGVGYNTPRDGAPGTGGTETWSFKAVGSGTTKIVLRYARPWGPPNPHERRNEFDVHID